MLSSFSPTLKGFMAILMGAVFIGFSGLIYKASNVEPATGIFWRMFLALPFFFAWYQYEQKQQNSRANTAKEWLILSLCGLTFALDMVTFHYALDYTMVGKATLLGSLASFFVIIFALILGEKPTPLILTSLGLAIMGGAIMISNGTWPQFSKGEAYGDLIMLLAATFFAAYIVFMRKARLSLGAGTVSFYSALFCSAFTLLFALLRGENIMPQTLASWGWLLLLGFMVQAFGQGLTTYALGKVPAGIASIVMQFNAVIATLAAIVWVNEVPSILQVLGGILVIFALILIRPRK